VATALLPVVGYDKASKIAHYALDNDLTLKEDALKLGLVAKRSSTAWLVRPTWSTHMLPKPASFSA